MNVRNVTTLLTLLFLPAFASADASGARATITSGMLDLILIIGFLLGLISVISGGHSLILMNEQGQKNGKMIPVVYILAGVIMMNAVVALGVIGSTVFNVDGACFIVIDNKINDSCMNTEVSGVTGELKTRIEKLSSGGTAQVFLDNVRLILGMFQVIGLIYFFVGVWGLKEVAKGSAQNGYGKPIVTMIASALIFDLPYTAQVAIDTMEKIGINF